MIATKSKKQSITATRTTQDQIREKILVYARPMIGAFTPVCVWWISHYDAPSCPALWALVLGGVTYSAWTVYDATRYACNNAWKAVGFTLMMEGVLVFSPTPWLAYVALVYLVVLNAIATGTKFSGVK